MKIKLTILVCLISFIAKAQLTIKGKVVDEFNNPLPFVNVFVQGTQFGAITDDDGNFDFLSKKEEGILEASFVGFQTQTIKINSKTKFLNITLIEGDNVLEEVVLVTKPKKRLSKKENPAYKILKEIWKRKRKNGLSLVKNYQYKKHTSIEVGLNNLDSVFIKKMFKKEYNDIIKNANYDNDGVNYYLPIYLSEQVSNVYGNNKTNKIREDIEAEKKDGLGADGFVFDRMSNSFKNINVFKNNITLMQKSFVSPLSTNGFSTYDYLLYDSIVKNNKKLYNIYFFPIRDEDLAFRGNFWVSDKNFSIKKIKMEVNKSANLNFIRRLIFEKEFEVKNDSIYLATANKYEGDFTLVDKNDNNKGLTIKKTENYDTYVLNKPLPDNFYEISAKKTRPNQYYKDDKYWNKVANNEDKNTHILIQKIKSKKRIKNLTGLINTLATGYIDIAKNIQFGRFWNTFGYNNIEGLRTKLGFRTFKTKDDRFRLLGYVAYGFKDKKIKYGAEANYLLSYEPRIAIGMAYQDDIQQLGASLLNTDKLLGESFGSSVLFSRGNNYFLSNIKKFATNFDYAINPNFHIGFNFTRATITSSLPEKFSINYLNENGEISSSVTNFYSDFYISFTPNRNVYGLGVKQRFGQNLFPTLILNYKRGYKGIFGGTHDYSKLQIKYNHPIVLGKIGILDTTIELGKTFGTVPISLLSPIPANQSYSLVKDTFSLMNYYDYVTDTYATAHFEHHFNGFILNRIPLIKKLKLRSLITFRAVYGTVSNSNRAINDKYSSIEYNTPNNKPYYEYGFGIENIGYGNLRFFRIDAIWRTDYTPAPNSISKPTPKFGIRIGIKPGL
ncbi:MAG: carboxypeptidase-like regulatory domain-containing protein [Tenacibaculum sp.]|nr:carboxypeptidase-like regulatory domain-containing protein [Tenacibaculum sp.]